MMYLYQKPKVYKLVTYWIQLIFYRSLYYLFRVPLAIYYRRRGNVVPPIRNPLLLKSAKTLAKEIRNGKLKSVDIVQAYIDRIQEVEPYLNAVVEDRFQKALKEAAEVDELIESGSILKQQLEEDKPLLGVPFTVKIALKVKGCRCTAGCKLFKDFVAKEDAPSVTLLKNAGGIVLAVTNTPEFCINADTNNLVHGKTSNPYNTSRTPGGSSGGECALIAAGASVIGLGNDLAGSMRIPASFTGIYGHKATRGLIPNRGNFPTLPDELYNYVVTGPLCRFVEDLVMMMKILIVDNEKSSNIDSKVNFKKLKIFYWSSLKDPRVIPSHKEVEKTTLKAISHFVRTYNATAQEMKIPFNEKMNDIIGYLLKDHKNNFLECLTVGKMTDASIFSELFKLLIGKSNFSLGFIIALSLFKCPFIFPEQYIPYYRGVLKKLTEEIDNLLDENSVIICPTFPQTALYHYEGMFVPLYSFCYTSLCNYTGLPGIAIPMGLSNKGMPLGIQIIAKKNNDSLLLACAEELSGVFGGWVPPGN